MSYTKVCIFVAIMLTINFKLIIETTINVCYYLRVNDVSDSCVFVSVNQTRYNIKEMLTFGSLKIGEPGYSSFLFFFYNSFQLVAVSSEDIIMKKVGV